MKTLTILFLLCCSSFAYPDKDRSIEDFIALQAKILEIAKAHQADTFEKGTSTLKMEVQQKIGALKVESLPSEQLFRVGIACFVASYPQEAGDQRWDLVFDDVCWRCVEIISSRAGSDNAHYLRSMKSLCGTDAGSSLRFGEYIAAQSNLEANKPEMATPRKPSD